MHRLPWPLPANGTGRDHNPGAFTCFLAGAGVKKGFSYGESDEFSFPRASAPWKEAAASSQEPE